MGGSKKILIAGGTGLIGHALARFLLDDGRFSVRCLSRRFSGAIDGIDYVLWDGETLGDWQTAVEKADVVINLSGASVGDRRWTKDYKKVLLSSRLNATRCLVSAIDSAATPPSVFINASAIGYYGLFSEPFPTVNESSAAGDDFLADLCLKWEKAALLASDKCRVVLPRFGVALSGNGGALAKMLPPFRFFLGGCLGHGDQGFNWIHIDDVLRGILFLIENESLSGPVNFTCEQPCTMLAFSGALGAALNRPTFMQVPGWAIKLGVGEFAESILYSPVVQPTALLSAGFSFSYVSLESAFRQCLRV